jgi:ATP-binding cassette, subfamily B, bacterial
MVPTLFDSSARRLFGRALAYFRADATLIALLVVLIACSVGLGLLQAWPMAILIDVVLTHHPKSDWVHRLFLAPLPNDKLGQVIGVTLIGMLLKIIQDTIWMTRMMINCRLKYNGTTRVRGALYNKLQDLGLAYHKSCPQGDAIYRLSNDTYGPFGVLDTFIGACTAAVTLSAMTAIMLTRNLPLTLVALSITPVLILVNKHFGRTIRTRSLESKQRDTEFTTVIQRAMQSIGLIQSFGRQSHEAARFGKAVDRSVDAAMRLNWQEHLYPLAVQTVFALGGAVIFGYGGYLVYRDQFLSPVSGGLSAGDLLVFMVYLGQLWDPLGLVLGFAAKIQGHAAATERVFKVLDENPSIADLPGALELPLQSRTLELQDVQFSYRQNQGVLRGISAQISPGEMVAFVGGSGAGKTTLLNLLPRFYDPTSGHVRLDGLDLRQIKIADVRRHMAIVAQDSVLFAGTIAENIAYGNPHASTREIVAAAELAGADSFIDTLSKKYATEITENGQNLSGGQRQRIAIARALLSQAPILILDEPTSALDPQNEALVTSTLERLKGERTIVLVTHRLETVTACDQIFVMDEGQIVDSGTHDELLATSALYAAMWQGELASTESSEGHQAA